MKTKSGGSRARLSKLPSPSPATRSLPFLSLNSGEVYGECSMDRTVDRMSRERNEAYEVGLRRNDAGASCCSENNEIDVWAEGYDDLDLGGDFMDSDLEIKTCIICLKCGGDDVLLCSEIGCPVAVHKKCAPEFDGLEKYYCPYCVYKHAELRKKKLKKKAMDSKKHLSGFLDCKPSGGDNVWMNEKTGEGKESNTLAPSGEGNCGDGGDRVVTNQVEKRFVLVESGQQNDEDNTKLGDLFAKSGTVIEHQRDALAPNSCLPNKRSQSREKLPGVESLVDSVSKEQSNEQNVTMNKEPEISEDTEQVDEGGHESIEEDNVAEENVVDGSQHLSEKGASNAVKPKRRMEEAQSLPEASGIDHFDSDKEPISMRQRLRSSEGKKKAQAQNVDSLKKRSSSGHANPEKLTISRNVKVTAHEKSRKQEASATKSKNLPFANEKRKRKDWKTEEEEMLREAVHKFSSTVNKNLPWRKMLEFGRHVFDPTRNPADLKDKWRNMKAKESSSRSRK